MRCLAVATSTGKQCQRSAVREGRCGTHQVGLADVATSDDRLKSLRKLRQVLADAIDDGPAPRDLASLSRRYMQVIEEIEVLTGGREEQASVDGLAAQRAERRAAAAGSS